MDNIIKPAPDRIPIGTRIETKSGKYIAGIGNARWGRSRRQYTDPVTEETTYYYEDVIYGGLYIDEILDGGERVNIFRAVDATLSTNNAELKEDLEIWHKAEYVENWGEFFLLFKPILDYYRQAAEEQNKKG